MAALVGLPLWLLTATGWAAPPTVDIDRTAVAPPVIDEALDVANRSTAERAFVDGLTQGGVAVDADELVGTPCHAAACARDVATARGVRHVVTMSVRKNDADYEFELSLWDAQNSAVIAELEETCEICGLAEFEDSLRVAANSLAKKIDQLTRPANLVLRSRPPGATVLIDGQSFGTTPVDVELMAGKHILQLEFEGHQSLRRDLELVPGVEETLDLELDRVRVVGPEPIEADIVSSRGRGLRAGGWTALGLGIGGMGAGVALLVMDERPVRSDCQADADGDCRFRHDTLGAGIALVTVGAVVVATGIALVVAGKKKQKRARPNATFTGSLLRGNF